MINTLLVIFFALSSTAGSGLTGAAFVQPEIRVEVACAQDEAVSDSEAQALYNLMNQNRERIFENIGEKTEVEAMADLEALLLGSERVLVSAAE